MQMLMAGAVKLQSGCPSWHSLTALDYHYATQVRAVVLFGVAMC